MHEAEATGKMFTTRHMATEKAQNYMTAKNWQYKRNTDNIFYVIACYLQLTAQLDILFPMT